MGGDNWDRNRRWRAVLSLKGLADKAAPSAACSAAKNGRGIP